MLNKQKTNIRRLGTLVCGTISLTMNGLSAEEFTVERGEFEQVVKLDAVAMPTDALPISISPVLWKEYSIKSFVTHGTKVKQGDSLLTIDTESLDEKIEDLTQELVKKELELERAALKYSNFKAMNAESLAEAGLKYKRFLEDYKHYQEVIKPVEIADLEYGVTRAKNSLSYNQEELDQLLKMYEEDGLTEETEEIIVERVKHSLESAQRNLDRVKRDEKHEKSVIIPRSDADWEVTASKEKRMWELAQKNLPLDLKIEELELSKVKRDLVKAQKELTELKKDRKLMDIVSPVDGIVYYGEFKDGKWVNEAAKKAIRTGGKLPADVTVMSVVPQDAKLTFNAFFTDKQKALLSDNQLGSLRLETQPWKSNPVKAKLVNDAPLLDQQWIVSFIPEADLTDSVIIGAKANVTIITAVADDVLSIPKKAVKSHADGTFSVKIKMADDEPQKTEIQIGRESGSKLEVLNGLENGQVIILPESKS